MKNRTKRVVSAMLAAVLLLSQTIQLSYASDLESVGEAYDRNSSVTEQSPEGSGDVSMPETGPESPDGSEAVPVLGMSDVTLFWALTAAENEGSIDSMSWDSFAVYDASTGVPGAAAGDFLVLRGTTGEIAIKLNVNGGTGGHVMLGSGRNVISVELIAGDGYEIDVEDCRAEVIVICEDTENVIESLAPVETRNPEAASPETDEPIEMNEFSNEADAWEIEKQQLDQLQAYTEIQYDQFDSDDMKPDAVQAFLDAVNRLPLDIETEQQAADIGEAMTMAMDCYEAILGTEYEADYDVEVAAAQLQYLNNRIDEILYGDIGGVSTYAAWTQADLQAAFSRGGNIVLPNDIAVAPTMVTSFTEYSKRCRAGLYAVNQTISLDLNGHSITYDTPYDANSGYSDSFALVSGGRLTITDSIGTGGLYDSSRRARGFHIQDNCTVSINGVNMRGDLRVFGGTVTINNSTFSAMGVYSGGITLYDNSSLTMKNSRMENSMSNLYMLRGVNGIIENCTFDNGGYLSVGEDSFCDVRNSYIDEFHHNDNGRYAFDSNTFGREFDYKGDHDIVIQSMPFTEFYIDPSAAVTVTFEQNCNELVVSARKGTVVIDSCSINTLDLWRSGLEPVMINGCKLNNIDGYSGDKASLIINGCVMSGEFSKAAVDNITTTIYGGAFAIDVSVWTASDRQCNKLNNGMYLVNAEGFLDQTMFAPGVIMTTWAAKNISGLPKYKGYNFVAIDGQYKALSVSNSVLSVSAAYDEYTGKLLDTSWRNDITVSSGSLDTPLLSFDINQDGIVNIYDGCCLMNVIDGSSIFLSTLASGNISMRDNYFRCDLDLNGVVDQNDVVCWSEGTQIPLTIENREAFGYQGTANEDLIIQSNCQLEDGSKRRISVIGSSAFENCINLKSVVIPDGVVRIEDNAFSGCKNLKSVTLPDSIVYIGAKAFANTRLTSIDLPENMKTIGSGAFEYSKLRSVVIPNNVTVIEPNTFNRCSLETVKLPDNLKSIGEYAFYGNNLIEIDVPSTVAFIGGSAFGHNEFFSIALPDGLIEISDFVFSYCENLESVNIPDSVTSIGYNSFAHTGLTSIYLTESVAAIDGNPFDGCKNLSNIFVSENNLNYESIDGVLYKKDDCKLICYPAGKSNDSFTIPDFVKSVEAGALQSGNLKSIYVSANVTSISYDAFGENLNNIFVADDNSNYKSVNGVLFSKDGTELVLYPKGKLDTEYIIPNGTVTVGASAFRYCEKLQSVIMPDSVKYIDKNAFSFCTGLSNLTLSPNLVEIRLMGFYCCKNIPNLIVPNSVTTIATGAFGYMPHVEYHGSATGSPWGAESMN